MSQPASLPETAPFLQIQDLNIHYPSRLGGHSALVHAVKNLNFTLNAGESLGIVGESGSGKTQTALAILGLNDANAQVSGSIGWHGQDLLKLSKNNLNKIRGREISMVFQDPMTALNPYMKISDQLCEVLEQHSGLNHTAARAQALKMLDAVQIPDAARRFEYYPHEFSGGMRQRVLLAMSLLCRPKLLIADEPTTALDVTVQAEILQLLTELRQEMQMAMILISHDLGVIAGQCDRVIVMLKGEQVEAGSVEDIFYRAQHPYTQRLLAAVPHLSYKFG